MTSTLTLSHRSPNRGGVVAVPGTMARIRFSPAPRPSPARQPHEPSHLMAEGACRSQPGTQAMRGARGPRCDEDGVVAAMTTEQRAALHSLVHARSDLRRSRWARRDRGIGIAWGAMLVALLALAVTSIDTAPAFLRTADHLYAMEHSHEAAARTTVAAPSAASQSGRATIKVGDHHA